MANIRSFRELLVYQNAFEAAMEIFEITKTFPPEERYSLTDQIRRSFGSVCSNRRGMEKTAISGSFR
ncbi:MAG TPA: four helix bundle protein [Pyrinomonadaceae bacterium]|nr:four helix bundle protein [Pyrinomonadaceae bacterium]